MVFTFPSALHEFRIHTEQTVVVAVKVFVVRDSHDRDDQFSSTAVAARVPCHFVEFTTFPMLYFRDLFDNFSIEKKKQ